MGTSLRSGSLQFFLLASANGDRIVTSYLSK